MSWEKVKLGEVAKVSSSKRIFAYQYVDKGIPFYRQKEIILKQNKDEITNPLYISLEVYENIKKKFGVPQKGDLLITAVGSLGIPYIVEDEKFYFKDGNLIWLKGFDKRIDSNYIYYWALSKLGQNVILSRTIGSAQSALTIDILKQIEIPCPSLDIQKSIVDILKAYDNLIENNQKQIKLLEEVTQRLYKEWFIDSRFPGHENVEVVDGVPEGWSIRPFNEVFSYVRGKSYKSSELSESEGVLLVNLKNINAFGGYKRNAEKRYLGTYKADQGLDAGDIVMGVTDMTQERRLVGHVAIVPDLGEKMTFSMDLIKLIPKSVTRGYLYSAMRFGRYSEQVSRFANGVNVLHLKPEAIMNMIMVVPSKDILERYENIFESYREKIELLEKQSNYLIEARNRLLPKLMSGEIKV